MRASLPAAALAAAAVLSACVGGDARPQASFEPARETGTAHHLELERVASGLLRPTFVGAAPGERDALWVLEQPGRVVRLRGRERRTLLDLRDRVRLGAEQGLLGLAFHPDFARTRRLYLHWSARDGSTRVGEFRLRADGRVGRRPRRILLRLAQPEENHNGGHLAFAPDGRLFLGLGDGGGAFDPHGNSQDPRGLLGGLVSVDVDASGPPRWRTEVYGLRNPWRFAFDPGMNEVWIGDVGQDGAEEVDRVALEPDEPPKNLGWPAYEGTQALENAELDRTGQLVFPVAAYDHAQGCSITGGSIYRGTRIPALSGRYVYGDFCSGALWTLRPAPAGRAQDVRRERAALPQLTHIGTDADGELVLATAGGDVVRAVPAAR